MSYKTLLAIFSSLLFYTISAEKSSNFINNTNACETTFSESQQQIEQQKANENFTINGKSGANLRSSSPPLFTKYNNFKNHYEFSLGFSKEFFEDKVFNSDKPWILVLYSKGCSRSQYLAQELMETFKTLSDENDPFLEEINIGTINCKSRTNKINCWPYYFKNENGGAGWPQIKIIDANTKIGPSSEDRKRTIRMISEQDIYDYDDYDLEINKSYLVKILEDEINYDGGKKALIAVIVSVLAVGLIAGGVFWVVRVKNGGAGY